MGGFSQLFDVGSTTRKVFAQKKHVQGLEAPRNSLELQIETSNGCAVRGHTQFYGVDDFQSERMRNQPDASMKKLIKNEISSRSTNSSKPRSPSVVARLMGMDVLPADSGSVMSRNVKEKESTRSNLSRRKNSISSGQATRNPSYDELGLNTESYNRKSNQKETWRREHPQEEELQKFKKEFEAWQAARFRECSQFGNLDQFPSRPGAREKPSHAIAIMKPSERDYTHKFGTTVPQKNGEFSLPLRNFENRSVDRGYATISGDKSNDFLHPTRIVILKPGPDTIWSNNESLTSSSGSDERGSSIEDFLHEVKERLRHELQGKALKKSSVVRGSGIETPFRAKPLYSKEVAQNIVNQVRDRDMELDLRRSGSTRSYRSEMYLTEPWSPEFIHKDTRRFLSERLRNVVKGDKYSEISEECLGGSTSHFIDYHQRDEKARSNCYPRNVDEEREIQVRSFRNGLSNDISIHKELSPRNLVRSMSAPVSGTSFGKLLLEDRHVLTGAHIRRKQEACESHLRDAKKTRREKFNFKERVHNIKNTFTLRRRLFGKRIPSIKESRICEPEFFKDMSSGPTVLTNFGERFENSTEVPPSPASVCSSAQDEYWRPSSNLSPISTPDLSLAEDDAVPGVFREISMNLNKLRRQLNQLGSGKPIGTPTEQWTAEPEMPELDDKVESYIRDLLVASGWYDGSPELCLLKWDSLLKPIGDLAFKDVEECYRNSAKNNYSDIQENSKEEKATKIDHKLLHDLLNEVLPSVLLPAKSKNTRFAPLMVPRGSDLLCVVWEIVRELVYPRADEACGYSTEIMASWDLQSNPWMCLLDDQVALLCREVEDLIAEELVEEILKDWDAIHSDEFCSMIASF